MIIDRAALLIYTFFRRLLAYASGAKGFRRVVGTLLVFAMLSNPAALVFAADPDDSSEPAVPTVLTYIGDTFSVTVSYGEETGIPSDAELYVSEVVDEDEYNEYFQQMPEALGDQPIGYVRFFDISLMKDGVEQEPIEGTTVSVTLKLDETIQEEVSVVHIPDDEEAVVVDNDAVQTGEGTEVSFDADGFSAYAIVTGPGGISEDRFHLVTSLDQLNEADGTPVPIFIGHPEGYYFKNQTYKPKANDTRTGIAKTKPAKTSAPDVAGGATPYYFEIINKDAGQYKVYTYDSNNNKVYIRQNGNSLSLVAANQATTFTISSFEATNNDPEDPNDFCALGSNGYYWNQQGGKDGNGFCAWNTAGDLNARMYFWYEDPIDVDPYDLDGQQFGLMSYVPGINGRALMSDSSIAGHLDAQLLTVMQDKNNTSNRLFVPKDSDITMWKFTWAHDDDFYVSTMVGGEELFLNVDANGLSLVSASQKQPLRVVPGAGDNAGKIRLVSQDGTDALGYTGDISTGFANSGSGTSGTFLNLVSLSELNSDYYMVHSAQKVGACDIQNGQQVIIYTRVYNESTRKYDYYAIDHDGSLQKCYEAGDSIEWIGEALNTLLWDFTEYYYEGTTTPNYYYELYNQYSEKYIAPQYTQNQTLSDSKIGIHMPGRQFGKYYTTLQAWDDLDYHYSGLSSNGSNITVVQVQGNQQDRISEQEFYFAIVKDVFEEDELHEVPTIDNNTYGITMRMVDFEGTVKGQNCDTSQAQLDLMGEAYYEATVIKTGLVQTKLDDNGYPVATRTGKSFGEYFGSAVTVNNLFLSSTYNSSGYFEYDSCQNFASLDPTTNKFTVYQEIGSYDSAGSKNTLKHGQFFPYDTITPGSFASVNGQNLYNALAQSLPETYPRKYERLYMVGNDNPNRYFGMELTTSFVQTPSGLDDWGHPIIYEFTGDDDFWLFVDGELVIDLGGIHGALSGSIDFCTGEVIVNGVHTTLYDLFTQNYQTRGLSAQQIAQKLNEIFEQNDEGQWTFKDYTFHEMKIYYMERGGGASNLHMRFNQASVRPGTVLLSKEIIGTNIGSTQITFPFQIYYSDDPDMDPEDYTLLGNDNEHIHLYYQGTDVEVDYEENLNIDGYTYNKVFLLEAEETCEIYMPDDAIYYYIRECGVDENIYSKVYVNGTEVPAVKNNINGRNDYTIAPLKVSERTIVQCENEVNSTNTQTLTFTKWLYDEHGGTPVLDSDSTFSFRLYLDTSFDGVAPTPGNMEGKLVYMRDYYVRDPQGYYCTWDTSNGGHFVSTNITDLTGLDPSVERTLRFTTSANGNISKIPAFYTVEVRDLLPGTKYMVIERDTDMPDGYSRSVYWQYLDKSPFPVDPDNHPAEWDPKTQVDTIPVGVTQTGEDPHIDICNLKGWGLRIYKNWADDPFMENRAPTYFAVYLERTPGVEELVPGTVRRLRYQDDDTVYWYFPELEPGFALSDYHVREVKIENEATATVDANGKVTNHGAVTPYMDGEEITIGGQLVGETGLSDCVYTVHYTEGTQTANVRVDDISNDRYGLDIYKYEWDQTTPVEGAIFYLEMNDNGSITRFGPFTSDATGKVTTAFLREGVDYSLIENEAPAGHFGLPASIALNLTNDGQTVTITSGPSGYYDTVPGTATTKPIVKVYNKSFTKQFVKIDERNQPIEGAHFSLHKWKEVGGVGSPDLVPLDGYEDLVSDANGIIQMPQGWDALPAGTYALVEKEDLMPAGFQKLSFSVVFTVKKTGGIELKGTYPYNMVTLTSSETAGVVNYTVTVVNKYLTTLTIKKTVEGNAASLTQQFEFTIALRDENNQIMSGKVTVEYGDGRRQQFTLSSTGTFKVKLAHGEQATILGLHKRTRYSITENALDYTAYCNLEGQARTESNLITGMVEDDAVIEYVNRKNGLIPTGLDFTFRAIVGAVLVISSGMATFLFLQKRRRDDEDEEPEL